MREASRGWLSCVGVLFVYCLSHLHLCTFSHRIRCWFRRLSLDLATLASLLIVVRSVISCSLHSPCILSLRTLHRYKFQEMASCRIGICCRHLMEVSRVILVRSESHSGR